MLNQMLQEIRQLKNKLKTSRDNLKSRRKEGTAELAKKRYSSGKRLYSIFFALCLMIIFLKGYAKNIIVIQGLFLFIFKKSV